MKIDKKTFQSICCIGLLIFGSIFFPMVGSETINSYDEYFDIIHHDQTTIQLHLSINSNKYEYNQQTINNHYFAMIEVMDEGFFYYEGQAKLPVISRMIEIPYGTNPKITINNIQWKITSLEKLSLPDMILPVQPSAEKQDQSSSDLLIDTTFYQTDSYLPEKIITIDEIKEIRGRRVAVLRISPLCYRPTTGDLKLMQSCDITLTFPSSDLKTTYDSIRRYGTSSFEEMYSSLFLNYGFYEKNAGNTRDQEGYLIIVDDQFYDEITPFSNWKSSLGFDTTTTKTSDIPGGVTTTDIKNYIQNAYDTWPIPPAYVLLVGDTPQIPAWTGSACGTETDSYYGTMDGDIFPDIYISRFPANTDAHVTTMVNKTIYFEDGDFPSNDWIKKGAFIASSDHGQLAEDTHEYVMTTHLEPAGYICDRIYEASGGNNQDIHDALNEGRTLCIYSGHGSPSGWGCVPFYKSDVNSLMNSGMYPFVCSHACSTSTYEDTTECFAETWLRAENKGGLAFWGSSCSTYWDEDDVIERRVFDAWWYDGMDRIGPMTDKGMYDSYMQNPGLQIEKFMESYNVMGDSSVVIWSDDPFTPEHDIKLMDLQINDVIPHNQTQTVTASVRNIGNNTETGILIDFKQDSTVIDSITITSIDSMQETIVSFQWSPPIGTYYIEIESRPIPDEYDLTNNNVNKTINVIAAPNIDVYPETLTYLTPTNAQDTDIISISNLPNAEADLFYNLTYSGDFNGDWLSASPDSGVIQIGDSENITITVNTSLLGEGSYQGSVIIQCNDLDTPEIILPVDLLVVYGDDLKALSINTPTGIIPHGSHVINASVHNIGFYDQSDVVVNCTVYEGGVPGPILLEDFSSNPVDWTITSTSGTAWSWDSGDERMENTYSGSTVNEGFLDSPVIDCSGKLEISLSFWHLWDADYSSGDQDGYVLGSIDGGVTYPFLIDEFHHNDPPEDTGVKSYNLSWADNQENVVIRFEVMNDNDWYWYVDDFNMSSGLSGNVCFTSEALVNVSAYQVCDVVFPNLWNVTVNGLYTVQVETCLLGDQNPLNDLVFGLVEVFEDVNPPIVSGVTVYPNPQVVNGSVNISCDVIDETVVDGVFVDITGPAGFVPVNVSMTGGLGDVFFYESDYFVVGNYSFSVYAVDMSGNAVMVSGFMFEIVNDSFISFDMPLLTGWNMITVPMETNWYASDLIVVVDDCLMVSWFDAVNQTFRTATTSGGYDFPIVPGWGYFVYVTDGSVCSMVGPPVFTANVQLDVGWNMIGWYHDYDSLASSLMENITGCIMVSWYDTVNETYRTATSSGGYDFVVCRGMGLFVYATEVSVWHGEG